MRRLRRRDERGSMLIVSLGILTLLSVLALTFVSLMRLEQSASNNYVEGVKARLIAEGGLEQSMAQIKVSAGAEPTSDPNAHWIYAQGNYWLPLEEATSIRRGEPDDTPALNAIRASFAGNLGQSYANGADRYRVKVIDTQTQFNLNSVYEEVDGVDRSYVRFLDALGVAIGKLNPRAGGGTAGAGRNPIQWARYPKGSPNAWRGGEAIYRFRQSREGKRFNSKIELLEVLETEDDYALIKDYVTAYSWFDPDTVTARSLTGLHVKPWSDVFRREPRSPINVNLATTEMLAANLAGIAGRGIFLYTGDYSTRDARLRLVDENNAAYKYSGRREAVEYGTAGILVYIRPFGFIPGQQQDDPPFIHGAIRFAQRIKNRIQTQGPFKSFAEWEAWVDGPNGLTREFIQANRNDPDANAPTFGLPADAPMFNLDETPLSGTPGPAQVRSHPRFEQWYFDAVRAMIKSNFNPNARLSSWNPDPVVYLPIDKGGLLYFLDAANPSSTKAAHQTNEWCFGSKGIFEITSLGEIVGPPPADGSSTEPVVYAQSKVRGVMQLFETVSHRSQRDFERNGDTYEADRIQVTSYPVPRIYWEPELTAPSAGQVTLFKEQGGGEGYLHASEFDGWLQIGTRDTLFGGDTKVVELGGPPLFELLFQRRRPEQRGVLRQQDTLIADRSGLVDNPPVGRPANQWGWPFGTAWQGINPPTRSSTSQEAWRWDVLTPDGYLTSSLRNTELWFRASDRNSATMPNQPDGRLRGDSMPTVGGSNGGNIAPTPRGGVELWFKPEFDWSVRRRQVSGGVVREPIFSDGGQEVPDGRICGLFASSHIDQNDEAFQGGSTQTLGSWTRGTQMFIFRTTQGDIRISRMYYEVVGPNMHPQEEPLVADPVAGGSAIRFSEYLDRARTNHQYTWPPREFFGIPAPYVNMRWARTDHWIPYQTLKEWRAHEWHHLAFWWDDQAGQVRAWADGLPVNLVQRPPLGDRFEPFLPDPQGGAPIPYSDYENRTSMAPPPLNSGDGRLPSFVRLNAITGPTNPPNGMNQAQYEDSVWPKDQMMIGSVRRDQATTGGLFKFIRDAALHANGTIDEVRLYDGSSSPTANGTAERYHVDALWRNELDLSQAFPDNVNRLTLGNLSYTAYLPTRFENLNFPDGRGAVTVRMQVLDNAGQVKFEYPPLASANLGRFDSINQDTPGYRIIEPTTMADVTLDRNDRLVYEVEFEGATDPRGFTFGSPILDDVSVVYFLPNAKILYRERMLN